ncbi:bifunctional hydroxymethylpyrimidine kinase/phosphomethylpyrimidine kinase [Variovorax sp. OV329]|uniref:bifunctional hydroxymethylpyrimidine kinase/phosphomethylpyrimidine kinase n=1 Tax=Variovorax sp. OV329 TaxID=1882825 RepID=UPI0008E5D617|nr:bifunctional hydroxymethylpyrimidine kinase/phosphomethylpyrimidine kinase [Variovorax sp. OV329]SFM73840.1 hydroxymethylpyrimidine/phosphomethylpyrimidine kinase [Variovorax sp. OV329]
MKTFLLPPEDSGPTDDLSGADAGLEKSEEGSQNGLPCVLVFNASDPSGAGGLACDALAISSVGAHMLPVVTGAYARDTAEIFDHFAFDEEAVSEQARTILEDVEVQLIKVGFAGTPENLAEIAETASDYPEVPVVAYMPNLAWWDETKIDAYLDAFRELVLPQTTVLVGNHSTLWRWLLPDWNGDRPPTARDVARAAGEQGVPYTLVTGIVLPDQFFDNVLASPQAVLASEKYERLEAVFSGAGDTLSATLAALLASGTELVAATSESLSYMDRCLDAGFRPGMGHVIPDRLFWAQPEDEDGEEDTAGASDFALPPHETRH